MIYILYYLIITMTVTWFFTYYLERKGKISLLLDSPFKSIILLFFWPFSAAYLILKRISGD